MVVRLSRSASPPSVTATVAALLLVLSTTPTARGFAPVRTRTAVPTTTTLTINNGRGARRKRRPPPPLPPLRSAGLGRTVAASKMVLMDPCELIGEEEDTAAPATDPVVKSVQEQLQKTMDDSKEDIGLLNREAALASVDDVVVVGERIISKPLPEGLVTGEVVEEEEAGTTPAVSTYTPPKLRHIFKFAIPAIGVWLCGPLLSLIDTAAVGLLAGTNHQAALSPAVAVTDYSALLLAFLFTATTNLVASATTSSTATQPTTGPESGEEGGINATAKTTSSDDIGTTLFSSLQLSSYVGLGLGTVLFLFAPALVRTLIGRSTPIDPAVLNPAVLYVRIRSLGFPAAAVLGSAQAACLGLKDIRSPMLVLGTAAMVNLIADGLFVGSRFSLLHGAAGAAWATVLSQFAAVWLFLGLLKAKKKKPASSVPSSSVGSSSSGTILKLKRAFGNWRDAAAKGDSDSEVEDAPWSVRTTPPGQDGQDPKPPRVQSKKFAKMTALFHHRASSSPTAAAAGDGSDANGVEKSERPPTSAPSRISAKGFLSDRDEFRKRDILRLPSRERWSKFLPYVVPVTTTSVGRVSLFLSMAHVVSSCMGSAGMAAQSIIIALFEALCPVADSLSLTAQTFVPEALDHERRSRAAATTPGGGVTSASSDGSAGLSAVTRQFLKAGSIFGGFLVLVVACIPLISRIFTTDAAVISQVNAVAPYLAGVFAMHGVVMASEGVLLGRRDINFLGWMYGAYFLLMPAIMMRIKHGVISSSRAAGLQSIWTIFLGYQCSRTVLWVWRAMRPLQHPDAPSLVTSEE